MAKQKRSRGKPSNWHNTPTRLVRVPEVIADRVLEIAREMDRNLKLEEDSNNA